MSVTAALALLASGTPVITERWWFLFADDRRAWYADVLTATRSDGTTDLTYQMVHRVPRGRVMREVIRTNIDCPQRRSRVVAIDAFDIMDRHVKASQLEDPPWKYIVPDSTEETLWLHACSRTDAWPELGSSLVFREPLRVTLDYYSLIQIGTSDEDAIGIARYDRTRQMPEIKDFIDRSSNWQLRGRLLRVYGIPGDPGS